MTANSPEWAQAPTAPQNLSQKRPPPPPASVRRYLSLPDFEAAAARYLPRSIGGFVKAPFGEGFAMRRCVTIAKPSPNGALCRACCAIRAGAI